MRCIQIYTVLIKKLVFYILILDVFYGVTYWCLVFCVFVFLEDCSEGYYLPNKKTPNQKKMNGRL